MGLYEEIRALSPAPMQWMDEKTPRERKMERYQRRQQASGKIAQAAFDLARSALQAHMTYTAINNQSRQNLATDMAHEEKMVERVSKKFEQMNTYDRRRPQFDANVFGPPSSEIDKSDDFEMGM